MEIRWNSLSETAWTAALPDNACALQQSWRYGAAVAALGRSVQRAEIWDGDRFLGLAQVLLRRAGPLSLAWMPRGPMWMHPPSQPAQALQALRRSVPGLLLTVPEAPVAGLVPLVTPVCTAEIALLREPAAMRRRMHQKWRNRLVRAERSGLNVAVTAPSGADLDWLMQRDRAQGRARGYRGLPPAFLAAWAANGAAPMRLFTARLRGEVVAAMLFLDHAPGATYQIGWSGEAGRGACAHHLILWRAMRHFAGNGRRRLDLGPLDTVTAPGLARFKLGSGAAPRWLGAASLVLPGTREKACGSRKGTAMLRAKATFSEKS